MHFFKEHIVNYTNILFIYCIIKNLLKSKILPIATVIKNLQWKIFECNGKNLFDAYTAFDQNWPQQGRSDGVSRVSNAYGPTAERGPPKAKNYTRYLKKIAKSGKITNFGRFAYGPTRPSLRLWATTDARLV